MSELQDHIVETSELLSCELDTKYLLRDTTHTQLKQAFDGVHNFSSFKGPGSPQHECSHDCPANEHFPPPNSISSLAYITNEHAFKVVTSGVIEESPSSIP